jgi:hypothetical protein
MDRVHANQPHQNERFPSSRKTRQGVKEAEETSSATPQSIKLQRGPKHKGEIKPHHKTTQIRPRTAKCETPKRRTAQREMLQKEPAPATAPHQRRRQKSIG